MMTLISGNPNNSTAATLATDIAERLRSRGLKNIELWMDSDPHEIAAAVMKAKRKGNPPETIWTVLTGEMLHVNLYTGRPLHFFLAQERVKIVIVGPPGAQEFPEARHFLIEDPESIAEYLWEASATRA